MVLAALACGLGFSIISSLFVLAGGLALRDARDTETAAVVLESVASVKKQKKSDIHGKIIFTVSQQSAGCSGLSPSGADQISTHLLGPLGRRQGGLVDSRSLVDASRWPWLRSR